MCRAFFCFVIILQDLASNALYRSFTYAASTDEVAMTYSAMAVAVALSLGNFFVVATSVGWWLRWCVYTIDMCIYMYMGACVCT